jgi:hypothetical protein
MTPAAHIRTRAAAVLGRGLLLAATLALGACGDGSLPTDPPRPEARVVAIEVVGGTGQRIWSGRRSAKPFRVRVFDRGGLPVPGAEIVFRITGEASGDLSQPHALTDADGYAESWLDRTRSGAGTVVVEAGTGRAEIPFLVDRAPGRITILAGTGEVGLPGRLHPDSIIEARVLDTEDRPLAGQEVWFAASGQLSHAADTTDANGMVSVRLRRTDLSAGTGTVYAFVLGFPEVIASASRRLVRPVDRVVLVSVDGLRADAAERWTTPTLLRLAREGAVQPRAHAVSPSLTAPAHLSLLSGVKPAAHGVFGDELDFTPQMSDLDPLFRYASRRGRTTVAFMSREGPLAQFERALACRLAFGLDSLHLTAPNAAAVVDAAVESLADESLDLIFMHMPDPDLAGHRYGFNSPQYGAAVREVDAALERVRAAVEAVAGTLLIVTSDHGGGGAWGAYQHGSGSPEDIDVPVILWGARVAPGTLAPATLLDVAPTVLWALGMSPPRSYEGRPLLEGFR